MLGECESPTITQFILDLEYNEDLVDRILGTDSDGDRDGNGIDDRDSDCVSISYGGDTADHAPC